MTSCTYINGWLFHYRFTRSGPRLVLAQFSGGDGVNPENN